jgi:hypothetical protein
MAGSDRFEAGPCERLRLRTDPDRVEAEGARLYDGRQVATLGHDGRSEGNEYCVV